MLEVYSINRAARPRWSIAATGLLLALSTGMAALLAHQRTAAANIQLGESKSYAGLGLRARLPVDWEIAAPEQTDLGQILISVQPGEESDRELVLFRAKPMLLGIKAVPREDAVLKAVQTAMPNGRIVHSSLVGTSKIGALTSEVYQIMVLTQQLKTWGLANVSTGPGRQTFGVVILVGDQLSIRDQKLLEEISQSILLEGTTNQHIAPTKPGKPENQSGKPMARIGWTLVSA